MSDFSKNRVIMIEDASSDWYEKAIFILKKDISPRSVPKNIVKEAEDIIDNYIRNTIKGENKKKSYAPKIEKNIRKQKVINHSRDVILNWCLVLSTILFLYYIYNIFF